jgi:hypothetical protein
MKAEYLVLTQNSNRTYRLFRRNPKNQENRPLDFGAVLLEE